MAMARARVTVRVRAGRADQAEVRPMTASNVTILATNEGTSFKRLGHRAGLWVGVRIGIRVRVRRAVLEEVRVRVRASSPSPRP